MTDHDHPMPPAEVLIGAHLANADGRPEEADRLIDPWCCCANGVATLIAGHFSLALALCTYTGAIIVIRDDGSNGELHSAVASMGNRMLAEEIEQGIAELAAILRRWPEESGPELLRVATSVLGSALHASDAPPLAGG